MVQSPDRTRVLFGSAYGVRYVDAANGAPIHDFLSIVEADQMAFISSNRAIATSWSNGPPTLHHLDLDSGTIINSFGLGAVASAVVSAGGRVFVAEYGENQNHTVSEFDLTTGTMTPLFTTGDRTAMTHMASAPDGSAVYAGWSNFSSASSLESWQVRKFSLGTNTLSTLAAGQNDRLYQMGASTGSVFVSLGQEGGALKKIDVVTGNISSFINAWVGFVLFVGPLQ